MKIKHLLLTLSVFILFACNQDNEHKTVNGSSIVGKPHAPVSMTHEYLNTPALDKVSEIKLIFSVKHNTETLQVSYKTTANLKSVDVKQHIIFAQLEKGDEESFVIKVMAEKAGLSYVNVFATITTDGKSQSRSFAVPVNIDSTDKNSAIQQTQSKSSDKHLPVQNVISMPAVESSEHRSPQKSTQ